MNFDLVNKKVDYYGQVSKFARGILMEFAEDPSWAAFAHELLAIAYKMGTDHQKELKEMGAA